MTRRLLPILAVLALTAVAPLPAAAFEWTADEIAAIRSLRLGSLPPLPPDPSNPVADDPRAVDFGHRLFFDRRLSSNGEVACVSCHRPELAFTDGREISEGVGETNRNAPTLVGIAYSPWFSGMAAKTACGRRPWDRWRTPWNTV